MDQETKTILSVARAFKNYIESEGVDKKTLNNLKYFKKQLTQEEIIDVLSDIKHRIFPRPFERLSKLSNQENLVGVEIGVAGGEHALSILENLNIKSVNFRSNFI